jgi:uncharacterized protein (UPF0276 family)
MPTLLERDFNIPPVDELLSEVNQIKQMQSDRMLSEPVSSGEAAGANLL